MAKLADDVSKNEHVAGSNPMSATAKHKGKNSSPRFMKFLGVQQISHTKKTSNTGVAQRQSV